MTNNHRTVFVTGETGKQGGSVARHMLGRGWNLKALTRDPASRAAKALGDKGVEVVQGDLEPPARSRMPCAASMAFTACRTSGPLA